MPIPEVGYCISIKRELTERRESKNFSRTIGEYQCYWNGAPLPSLNGQIVERQGPGNNTKAIGDAQDLRIAAGTYGLAIHYGKKYRTTGYSESTEYSEIPRPGLLLLGTQERTYILLHPAQDYVASVGCLNTASGLLDANSSISYKDSRARVIAIIDSMKELIGHSFPVNDGSSIPGAIIVISGEP